MGGSDAQAFMAQLSDDSEKDLALPQCQPDAEVAILYRQAIELIRGEFSERDWQAFDLVVLREQSPRETAEMLQVSVNTVYLAKSRILRRLREEFAEAIGEPRFPGASVAEP
jgi:RNA polymerase sigma-70 factor (ECF subfamily)